MARGRAWKWVAAGIFIIAVFQVVLISLTVSPDEDGVDNVDDGGQPLAGHVHSEQRPLYAVRDSFRTHISAHLSVCTLGLPHFLAQRCEITKIPSDAVAFIPQRPLATTTHCPLACAASCWCKLHALHLGRGPAAAAAAAATSAHASGRIHGNHCMPTQAYFISTLHPFVSSDTTATSPHSLHCAACREVE
jgi:hypothetical protein